VPWWLGFVGTQCADAPSFRTRAAQVTNAMSHATDSLEYMSRLRDPQVFRFCAIPQVMAIATLAECYDNPRVFKQVVKISRSTRRAAGRYARRRARRVPEASGACSARIMVTTKSMPELLHYFRAQTRKLELKARAQLRTGALHACGS
jgi:hypothetical protein